MTIHTTHPFADPEPDAVRRFRGRLGGAVTLWTAGSEERRAGLTVSSLMVANGETPTVLALIDPDSDLIDVLRESGRAVVQLLAWADRGLAEVFAGTAPAPGGAFRQAEFLTTAWGPRLASAATYAHVVPIAEEPAGWATLVTCRLESAYVGEEDGPALGHRRGRYFPLGSDA
jgi:flavin reductase (DIM6/NTAB) family NADH-FMN oxidoreductase RutF